VVGTDYAPFIGMERDIVHFNGIEFIRFPESKSKSSQRYYFPFANGRRMAGIGALHQAIWKWFYGPIPDGYHIHHKDGCPLNNLLENLECVTRKQHGQRHAADDLERTRAHAAKIRPLTKEWHASEAGRAWHSEHGKRTWEGRIGTARQCEQCGNVYQTKAGRETVRFCSRVCINAYHHANRTYYEDRNCSVCGQVFNVKKSHQQKCCSRKCGGAYRRRQT